jgi:hypothetical protein
MTVASATLTAPHASAVLAAQAAGFSASYGASNASPYVPFNLGNKKAVLTKVTAIDLYEAGGIAISPAAVGLSRIDALLVIGSSATNVLPNNSATAAARGVPTLGGTATAPKVKLLIGGADVTATTDVTGTVFHVILVGN